MNKVEIKKCSDKEKLREFVATTCVKQKLKGEIDVLIIILGNFNPSLSKID